MHYGYRANNDQTWCCISRRRFPVARRKQASEWRVIRVLFNGRSITFARQSRAEIFRRRQLHPRDATCSCEQSLGIQKALLTTWCTHALEMAALLVGIRPEDNIDGSPAAPSVFH